MHTFWLDIEAFQVIEREINGIKERYPFLSTEVANLNGSVGVSDGGVDRKVSVDKSQLVAIALDDTSDEILNVTKGSADGSVGLSEVKPSFDLEFACSGSSILDEKEIKVQMLEVVGVLASRTFHLESWCDLDLNHIGMSIVSDESIVFIFLNPSTTLDGAVSPFLYQPLQMH
ncbi:hypothetical protein GH714_010087 [Hevea brasiliensis]|uniref:Uncharacterized protein n=1 Tax=Hevea brasiliensis TaxID=3981 RepID=A0A6A6LX56_HEVBR|nr:hypothetical protein GH714_010087 [Hevea brasiliensis]